MSLLVMADKVLESSSSIATDAFEDETALMSIFDEKIPEEWKGDPDFITYLSQLSSFSRSKLISEPSKLEEEKCQLLNQTQELAFHNYKTFIQTAKCSKEIFSDFSKVEERLDDLLKDLPAFSEACQEFAQNAQKISASRHTNSLTLSRHAALLDVLEIPQLMDTCVRNSYYEEALELAQHVRRMEKKHSHIPVVMNIVKEVRQSHQLMLQQLLAQLRTSLQLPQCLKVIGYLRRMDVFTEAELRIKFLQARDSWLDSMISNIPADDVYHHITKVVEISRVNLFDIITQYRAIFTDDDPLLHAGGPKGGASTPVGPGEPCVSEANIFQCWLNHKMNQFLDVLTRDLELGVGPQLDALLGQCMYFGLSLSRVGADFRGLMVLPFCRASAAAVIEACRSAASAFDDDMSGLGTSGLLTSAHYQHQDAGGDGAVVVVVPPYVPPAPEEKKSGTGGGVFSLPPPPGLVQWVPLARYTNTIVGALSGARSCLPASCGYDIQAALHASLGRVATAIAEFYSKEQSLLSDKEMGHFRAMCASFCLHLVPYLSHVLLHFFPPDQISATLGFKVKASPRLDVAALTESLATLLPPTPPLDNPTPFPSEATSSLKEQNPGDVADVGQKTPQEPEQLEAVHSSDQAKDGTNLVNPPAKDLNLIQPAESAMPQMQPAESAMPQMQPAGSAMPQMQPAEFAMPQMQPAGSAMSQMQPAESAMPQMQPAESTMPQMQPAGSVMPQMQPAESALPQMPVNVAESDASHQPAHPAPRPHKLSDIDESQEHVPGKIRFSVDLGDDDDDDENDD